MKCIVCGEFLPPGFTERIDNTKYHKCKFCKEGKDKILNVSTITGDLQWDVKERIVNEYKEMINRLVRDKEARLNLIKGIEK